MSKVSPSTNLTTRPYSSSVAPAAREILAEVFGVTLSEVDEMVENRFQAGEERRSREDGMWPQELWVEG